MEWEAIVHEGVWKEIPVATHQEVRGAMRALARLAEPSRAADVRRLERSRFGKSYRLRTGRYRILFIVFPDVHTIVFTTGFLKKRDSDYDAAVQRHDARVRAYE